MKLTVAQSEITIHNDSDSKFQGSISQNILRSIWFPMRQVNFVIIFIFCLAFALFTIQNTQPSTIHVIPGVQVQAPIAVELLLAIGLGAVLAWFFSIWTHWQRLLLSNQKVRQSNVRIQELESKLEQYQLEIQSLKLALPPAGDTSTEVVSG